MAVPDSVLSIDVGGTKMLAALVRDGAVLETVRLATPRGGDPSAWFEALFAEIASWQGRYSAVGLAVTGVFAFLSGRASIWWSPFPPLAVALSAASLVFGWWRASRAARWALAART